MSRDEYTVLSDWSQGDEQSHREIAETLLPKLKEELPEERYEVDFLADLKKAVLRSILRDLESNLEYEDWHGMGFEEPEDFLDADEVSEAIASQAKWYFEDDQTGKSWEVLQVILEYAEECGLVQRRDESGDDDPVETCELCGGEAGYLHSITSERGLATGMQSRLGICSGCHDAIEAAEGDECAWCGASNASTVTVVGTSEGDYTLGRLCQDCQDGVNA